MCLPKEAVNLSLESLIFFSRILRVKKVQNKTAAQKNARKNKFGERGK
jgi:hypothetical protein